jgi:hypothetical protein
MTCGIPVNGGRLPVLSIVIPGSQLHRRQGADLTRKVNF